MCARPLPSPAIMCLSGWMGKRNKAEIGDINKASGTVKCLK